MAGVVGLARVRRPAVVLARTAAIAVCYYAAGRLGLLRRLVVDGAVFTPIWPPTGVAVTCLLIFGIRAWPGITLGALLVGLSVGPPGPDLVGIVAGQTAAPVCAYLLLRRVGFRTDLGRLRDGLALVFLGALTAMLISATVGVGLLVTTGKLDVTRFWVVWLAWWVGDAMGVLIVTPILLMLHRSRRLPGLARWKEATALLLASCVLVPVAALSVMSVLFLVYPLLIWAALRFRLAGSMPCALFASVTTTLAATEGAGPFRGLTDVQVMIKLQAFNGTMALTALLLSAVIAEQRNTRMSVEQACKELAEVLEHLTAGDVPPGRTPADGDEQRPKAGPG
ncbi:MASE1 domain-containing protein [Streptomyces sp. NPDC026672]|uniref:MASE1 domain-containing protein n=1 Tax=unclassified Streptomyces TaxID=2593676 RepID=UPI00340768B3